MGTPAPRPSQTPLVSASAPRPPSCAEQQSQQNIDARTPVSAEEPRRSQQQQARMRARGARERESARHLRCVLREIEVELPVPALHTPKTPRMLPYQRSQGFHRSSTRKQHARAYRYIYTTDPRFRTSDSSSSSSASKMRSSSGRIASRWATSTSTKTILARVRASTKGLMSCVWVVCRAGAAVVRGAGVSGGAGPVAGWAQRGPCSSDAGDRPLWKVVESSETARLVCCVEECWRVEKHRGAQPLRVVPLRVAAARVSEARRVSCETR